MPKSPVVAELIGLVAQCVVFVVGLAVSLIIGMVLAAQFDGPGPLLVATIISGAGLLTSAAGSQALRDWLVLRDLED